VSAEDTPGVPGAELFSDAWAAGWAKEINASDPFHVAGAKWEDTLVLVMEPDPALGVTVQRAVCVELHRGECRAARAATADDLETAPYVLFAQAAIWKEVLHLEKIGINDDFFECGGSLLSSANLIAKINHSFKLKLPLSVIFQERTVSKLAFFMENSNAHNADFVNSKKERVDLSRVIKLIG